MIDDWPLKELEFKDSYKGFMNTADECTLRSYHASYLVERKRRPTIFLFNPEDYDKPNSMNWNWIRTCCIEVRLDGPLFE